MASNHRPRAKLKAETHLVRIGDEQRRELMRSNFLAQEMHHEPYDLGLSALCLRVRSVCIVDGDHTTLFARDNVHRIAQALEGLL